MPASNGAYFTIRAKIIADYLDKYPEAGSHTIARILVRDYPEYFTSYDSARLAIRYRRGALGEQHRSNLKNRKYVKIQPSTEF